MVVVIRRGKKYHKRYSRFKLIERSSAFISFSMFHHSNRIFGVIESLLLSPNVCMQSSMMTHLLYLHMNAEIIYTFKHELKTIFRHNFSSRPFFFFCFLSALVCNKIFHMNLNCKRRKRKKKARDGIIFIIIFLLIYQLVQL